MPKIVSLKRTTIESVLIGVFGQTILIATGILNARLLGAENRGYLAILLLFPSVLCQIGTFGFPNALVYYIAKYKEQSSQFYKLLLKPLFFQIVIIFILHTIVILIYLHNKPIEIQYSGYVSIFITPTLISQLYGMAILRGLGEFRLSYVMGTLPVFLNAIFLFVFYLKSNEYNYLIILMTLSVFTALIGFLTLKLAINILKTKNDVYQSKIEIITLKELFNFGKKGLIGNISPVEILKFDQFLAGLFLSPYALGIYVTAQSFINLPKLITYRVAEIAYPTIGSNLNQPVRIRQLIKKFFLVVLVLNILIIVPLIYLMPILIPFFFGKEFIDAIFISQVLLVSVLFWSLRYVSQENLRGIGHPEISTYMEVITFIILLSIGIYLINYYKLNGLIFTVLISSISTFILTMLASFFFLKTIKG